MIYTANAGMGPDAMIDQNLCGVNASKVGPYPSNPCVWTEIEEEFYQWSDGGSNGVWAGGIASDQLRW